MKVLCLVLCHVLAQATASTGVERRAIAGDVVAEFTGGDYLYPRFSPDGRTLAFVSVKVVKGVELDEVILYDFRNGRTRKLLDAATAKRYATYAAFVSDLEWTSRARLRVSVNDGDVDTEHLTFDTVTRRVVGRSHTSGDDFEPDDSEPKPFPPPAFELPDGRVVYQNSAAAEGVWTIAPKTGARAPVLPRPEGTVDFSFRGGTFVGQSVLLFLETSQTTRAVVVDTDGAVRELGTVEAIPAYADVRVLYRTGQEVAVLVHGYRGGERGSNPFYIFDGSRLVESSDYAEVADADIDARRRFVAFAVWTGDGTRRLVVRRLR